MYHYRAMNVKLEQFVLVPGIFLYADDIILLAISIQALQ